MPKAKPDLVGIAIFDRLGRELQQSAGLKEMMWRRRELENYLCMEEVLLTYAWNDQPDDLFGRAEAIRREQAMKESIEGISSALKTLDEPDPWSPDIKASDNFLDRLFKRYFEKLGLPNLLSKTDCHILARLVPGDKIDTEVVEKLDAIVEVARNAKPRDGQ